MRSYDAARRIFSFLEFVSWAVVVIGGIMVFYGLGNLEGHTATIGRLAIGFGLFLAYAGVVGAANVQNGRASIDSAEYSQQALKVARDQLEVSQQSLRALQRGEGAASYEDLTSKSIDLPTKANGGGQPASGSAEPAPELPNPTPTNPNEIVEHKGQTIEITQLGYVAHGRLFGTMDEAKQHVETADASSPPRGAELALAADGAVLHESQAGRDDSAGNATGGNSKSTLQGARESTNDVEKLA